MRLAPMWAASRWPIPEPEAAEALFTSAELLQDQHFPTSAEHRRHAMVFVGLPAVYPTFFQNINDLLKHIDIYVLN